MGISWKMQSDDELRKGDDELRIATKGGNETPS
jgi:hypothetical protein